MERFLLLVFAFLDFQCVISMKKVDVAENILSRNKDSVFYEDLGKVASNALKSAAVLLGAQIRKSGASDCSFSGIARMIDVPIAKSWQDIGFVDWPLPEGGFPGDIKGKGVLHVISSFVLHESERSIEEAAQLELNRSVKHLIRHDIDRSHVIFDIQDKKSDSSFFFLVLNSNKESLNKELFLDALIKRVVAAFPQATLTTEESDVSGRHCVQASYKIRDLFGEVIDLFQIPFYRCDSFSFVPICNSFIAENIALRFSIQKCHHVRRLYLMTLFPFNEGRGGHLTWAGEEKLRALTRLNNKQVLDSKVISIPQSFSAASREVIWQLDVGVAEDEIQPHSVDRSINSIQPNLVIESFGGVDIYSPKPSICPCILL